MKRIVGVFLLSILLCLSAIASAQDDEFVGGVTDSGTESSGGNIGMANPAAVYCSNQGYEYSDGSCVFPDGSSCDAWKFYRGECKYEPKPKPKPAPEPKPEPIVGPGTETPDDGGSVIDMANPAAVYCSNQGYEYSDESCVFPDGSSCDAWKFYRGECSYNPEPKKPIGMPNPASVYCKAQGYDLEIRTDPKTGGEVGYCIFPDGSSCEEWAFYKGECKYEPKPTPTPTPVPPAPKPQAPTATYTCDAPPVGEDGVILEYDVKLAPPSQVYFQENFVFWPNFEGDFPATSPALWIKTSSGWSWNAVCPLGAWMSEVMYLPRNGSVSLYLMDFSGNTRRHELGAAFEGYKQIILNANAPGLQMAIFTLDGVPSNVVFIDVKSNWTPCGTQDVSTSASPEVNLVP